jgi:pimeloyl-ACP methyl ester carboxylesterase
MAAVETCRLPVGGGDTVFCEVTGQGPALVLTHDAIVHRESWDAQFESLSRSHRVVRWDRRGYGRSDRPSAPYASDDDLARVVASVTDPPAVLIGSSNGGLLSIQCALEHPELVAALVLAGPIVTGLSFTGHFTSRGGRRAEADLPVADEIEYWSSTDPWFTAPVTTGARDRLRALLMANPHNLQPKEHLERAFESDTLPRLGQIAVPTLIITGEHDIADVHAHSGAIEAGIPGARRLVLPGSGHLPHLEMPGRFNAAVHGFLAAHPGPGRTSTATAGAGVPGHDDGTAFVRLRQGKLVDGPSGQRVWDNTAQGPYEIVCPGCGDDPSRDWSEISAELRRIRGIYGTKEGAEAALMDHIGMETR